MVRFLLYPSQCYIMLHQQFEQYIVFSLTLVARVQKRNPFQLVGIQCIQLKTLKTRDDHFTVQTNKPVRVHMQLSIPLMKFLLNSVDHYLTRHIFTSFSLSKGIEIFFFYFIFGIFQDNFRCIGTLHTYIHQKKKKKKTSPLNFQDRQRRKGFETLKMMIMKAKIRHEKLN